MTEADTAWLAGLLEGEGCFFVTRGNSIRISIFMSDEDVIDRVRTVTGWTNRIFRRKPVVGWKNQYGVVISGIAAERVMKAVFPYMGSRRGAKIKECLETYRKGRNESMVRKEKFYASDKFKAICRAGLLSRWHGIPSSISYVAKLLILFLLLSGSAMAQAPPAPSNTFALNAYAVALPGGHQTIAGTLAVPTWNITQSFGLRETTLISGPLNGYFGGFNYQLPGLSKNLNNASPYLNGNQFRFYITGSAGMDKVSGGSQHYAFLGGGGVLYDPTNSGKFTITLVEAQYAKLPGYANNTAIVASGIGTTPAALAKVAVAPVKMVAKVFRRTPSK